MQETFLPWLVPLLPLAGFLLNALFGAGWTRSPVAKPTEEPYVLEGHGASALDKGGQSLVGGLATAVVWVAFAISLWLTLQVQGMTGAERRIFSTAFDWISAPGVSWIPALDLKFRLVVDPLTSLMMLIITGVGALIHGYSMGYMSHEKGYARYFTYLNLFVFFMLLLVMASNFLVMFVGWEGVGLASYLLIGFFYERKSACDAGRKAFIVNRIGDAAFLVALFLLFGYFGTLEFYGEKGILTQAQAMFSGRESMATGAGYMAWVFHVVPLLLFLGAAGKSAQVPLYVWLPDAMEGPTPVSALIHAATMVTAGVYMVSRAHHLFLLSDLSMMTVAVVGLLTAILAASIGLAQNDIKKVLAYSTISQLGYMFLACGVGAFGAAMFHVTTHAFFKALLFLGSGSVIHAMGGEQDMRKMGGLAGKIKTTYACMFVGTLALSGIPPLSGFFSKDEILANAFAGPDAGGLGHPALWLFGWITAGMTAFYMWRMLGKTFLGQARCDEATAAHIHESPLSMTLPLQVLAFLAVVGGFLGGFAPLHLPSTFERFLGDTVAWRPEGQELHLEVGLEWGLVLASVLLAAGMSYWAFQTYKNAARGERLTASQRTSRLYRLIYNKWSVDETYDRYVISPGTRLARWLWRVMDLRGFDGAVNGIGRLVRGASEGLKGWQSGYVRNYALTMLVGVALVVVGCLLGLSGSVRR